MSLYLYIELENKEMICPLLSVFFIHLYWYNFEFSYIIYLNEIQYLMQSSAIWTARCRNEH